MSKRDGRRFSMEIVSDGKGGFGIQALDSVRGEAWVPRKLRGKDAETFATGLVWAFISRELADAKLFARRGRKVRSRQSGRAGGV